MSLVHEPEPEAAGPDRAALYRLLIGVATLALMAAVWPLWLDRGEFPRVPFLERVPALPREGSIALLGLLAAGVLASVAGLGGASAPRLVLAALLWLVLGDQSRLQPWLYQFALVATDWSFAPAVMHLPLARLIVASIYVHSGLSKLDHAFAHEIGPLFLEALLGRIGLSAAHWPPAALVGASLAMPAAELVVGLLLAFRTTRGAGLVGATLLHLGILLIVGPGGLDHSATVVGWNLALLAGNLVLFWPDRREPPVPLAAFARAPAAWLLGAAALLPLGERAGLWDAWPSWAVYASHVERVVILARDDDAGFWPESLRAQLRPGPDPATLRLDVVAWSRAARGAPPYPQARVGVAVAGWVSERVAPRPPRVIVQGRADWLTGRRAVLVDGGPDALRTLAGRYRLPARAAGEAAGRWAPRRAARW